MQRNLNVSEFDDHPQPVIVLDAGYQIQAVNPSAEMVLTAIMNTPLPMAKTLLELIPADQQARFQSKLDTALAGNADSIELKFLGTNGQEYWFIWHCIPVKNQDNQVTHVRLEGINITEYKLTELALREKEKRLERILSSISDHIYMTEITKDGRQINRYLSPTETLTGFPAEKLLSDWSFWPSTIIHPDDRDVAAVQANRLAQGSNSEAEYRLIKANGDTIWIRDSGRVERDLESGSLYVHGVVSDITERKHLQEQLVAIYTLGQELTLLHNKEDIIQQVLQTAAKVIRCNSAQCGLVNKADNHIEFLHQYAEQSISSINLQISLADTDHYCAAVVNQRQAIRTITANNPGAVLGVPMKVDEAVIGVLSLTRIQPTAFTPADERLLQALADQIAAALENARLYEQLEKRFFELHTLNQIGQVVNSSLNLQEILKMITNNILGLLGAEAASLVLQDETANDLWFATASGRGADFIHNKRMVKGQGIVGWVIAHGQAALVDHVLQDSRFYRTFDQDGNFATDSIICAPLEVKGKIIGAVEAINKETGPFSQEDLNLLTLIAAPAAIAIENARLYEQEQAQLRQLRQSQAQLIQVEKMAALGRLAASIAHEINNPLQSIDACLTLVEELIADAPQQPRVSRYLTIAMEEIERIVGIVQRLREFYRPAIEEASQAEDGLLEDEFYHTMAKDLQEIDVRQTLESVLELTDKKLQHGNISLNKQWGVALPLVLANAGYLKQVFLNLVLNATDAMANGGQLTIQTRIDRLTRSDQHLPQPAICIEFTDTGIGMTPEIALRVFEPLYTTKEHGSGLGLYTSYKIIEAHQGQITVTSQQGQGTTFTIRLPII